MSADTEAMPATRSHTLEHTAAETIRETLTTTGRCFLLQIETTTCPLLTAQPDIPVVGGTTTAGGHALRASTRIYSSPGFRLMEPNTMAGCVEQE